MKRKILNKIRTVVLRIVPAATAVVVLFITLASPVGAVGVMLQFSDYVYDVAADGQSVTLSFPSEYCSWLVYPALLDTVVARGSSTVSWYNRSTSTAYLYPIGDSWERFLDLSDIPSGSTGGVSLKIASDVDIDFPSITVGIEYWDNNHNLINTEWFYLGNTITGDMAYVDFELNIPSGATCCIFRCDIENITAAGNITLTLEDFYLHLSVSALYLQQVQSGKTNKLLEAVSDQLEEQGKTLDQILNGSQADQDAANDFKDQIANQEGVIKDAENTINNAVNVDTSAVNNWLVALVKYLDIPYANALALFWESTLLHNLLLMGAIFALLSFVLFGKKG